MNENEALSLMVAPGTKRPGKWMQGVVQIHLTRSCNLACYGCTQGSQLSGKTTFMSPDQFDQVCLSLKGYFGLVGVFGGNPAISPHFVECCAILRKHFPKNKCGLWCNDPLREEKGRAMRETFNPAMSNLNCHLKKDAYERFKRWWPESMPFGHDRDSRHSPPWVAMKDLAHLPNGKVNTEENRYEYIAGCDINKHWSAMVGVFRGQLRAWFCEIAGAQSMLHQDDRVWCPGCDGYKEKNYGGQPGECDECHGKGYLPDAPYSYPDTGLPLWSNGIEWWRLPMTDYREQVRKHCHECGVPLKGYGELAQVSDQVGKEQVSETHAGIFRTKRMTRRVELVTVPAQLGKPLQSFVAYVQNAGK